MAEALFAAIVSRVDADSLPTLVLHIEDDEAVARSTRLLLLSAGYRSLMAASRAQALELIQQGQRPDVLLVDFHLDDGSTGTEVAEEIMLQVGYSIPVILLTADLPNIEIPWMPGAPLLLASKPMHPQALLEAIEHFGILQRLARDRSAAQSAAYL